MNQEIPPSAKDDLSEKVTAWLEKQGYPLEMRIARTLKRRHWRVAQSTTYFDRATEKVREIDVVADLQAQTKESLFRFTVAVECKSGKARPWVFFTNRNLLNPKAFFHQRAANHAGKLWLGELCDGGHREKMKVLKPSENLAYGAIEALKESNNDVVFGALSGAAASASGLATEYDERNFIERFAFGVVAIPMVVIEAPMFGCKLNRRMEPVLRPLSRVTIVSRKQTYGAPHTIIDVVSASAFSKFAAELKADLDYLLQQKEAAAKATIALREHRRVASEMAPLDLDD